MKVAFLGNFTHQHCSEAHHAAALEQLGHEVIRMQEGGVNCHQFRNGVQNVGMFVWVHSHGWRVMSDRTPIEEMLGELRDQGIPTVAYHLDLYLGIKSRWEAYQHDPYITGGYLQHFFTVDSLMADWLNDNTTTKGHWIPAGVHQPECYMAVTQRPFDVTFVGSRNYHPEWPERPKLIDFLESRYAHRFIGYGPDFGRPVRGGALNQVYADAKVVVGDSFCPGHNYQGHYWSDRASETLGRGGFLLHPRVPYMDDVFADKQHLVYYDFNDYDQLAELIDYYLRNSDERNEIRRCGHQYVTANHTYTNRWKSIMDTVS